MAAAADLSQPNTTPRAMSSFRNVSRSIPPSLHSVDPIVIDDGSFEEVILSQDSASDDGQTINTLDNIAALGLSFGVHDDIADPNVHSRFPLESPDEESHKQMTVDVENSPFGKWMRHLHKQSARRQTIGTTPNLQNSMLSSITPARDSGNIASRAYRHKKSSSSSSTGFIEAVKSASISLASLSIAPRSRRTAMSSTHCRSDRSSHFSNGLQRSEDSCLRGPANDRAVLIRSVQRRRVLEEIISTEESYLADMKFLATVYSTFLNSIPTMSYHLRDSIVRNISDIIELHEELLGDLHKAVPYSEYSQKDINTPVRSGQKSQHQRWHSLDAVAEETEVLPWIQRIPGFTAEPAIAGQVSKVFGRKLNRFFAYEEYGAKYETMVRDVASAHRTIPQWDSYQRGLETLAVSLASVNSQSDNKRKSLTVGDLLVKPIQRVCKYPLLFAELLKQTPVCDCPESYAEIEQVLGRFRETTARINRATDDPDTKSILERTWILQDRLVLPYTDSLLQKTTIRSFGNVLLCGVLHAVWQTKDTAEGQYLISILYKDCFVLATADMNEHEYTIQAKIGFSDIRVEEIDNGKGIQCHTAPFSWKLVFECDHQLYEIILSACSAKEELEWKSRIVTRLNNEASKIEVDLYEQRLFSTLNLDLRPMGTVFGKPGTVARRISIKRATTVGARNALYQVVIKNASLQKDLLMSPLSTSLHRSQSLLTSNRTPIITPSRVERARLENLIGDVWSKDVLPLPSTSGRARGENLRASAQSMMRKFSAVGIASNFAKRSSSRASLISYEAPQTPEYHCSAISESLLTGLGPEDAKASVESEMQMGQVAATPRPRQITGSADQKEKEGKFLDVKGPRLAEQRSVPSLKRLKTLRMKKSWYKEAKGRKEFADTTAIEVPLRASSANTARLRGPVFEERRPSSGSENLSQLRTSTLQKKNASGNHHVITEGILGFFR